MPDKAKITASILFGIVITLLWWLPRLAGNDQFVWIPPYSVLISVLLPVFLGLFFALVWKESVLTSVLLYSAVVYLVEAAGIFVSAYVILPEEDLLSAGSLFGGLLHKLYAVISGIFIAVAVWAVVAKADIVKIKDGASVTKKRILASIILGLLYWIVFASVVFAVPHSMIFLVFILLPVIVAVCLGLLFAFLWREREIRQVVLYAAVIAGIPLVAVHATPPGPVPWEANVIVTVAASIGSFIRDAAFHIFIVICVWGSVTRTRWWLSCSRKDRKLT